MEGRVSEEPKSHGKQLLLSSQGSSEHHRVEKKKKKKRPSHSMFVITDANGVSSEPLPLTYKRDKKKKKRPSHSMFVITVQRAIEARKRETHHESEIDPFLRLKKITVVTPRMMEGLHMQKKALKFYEKSQGARFEIVEVFYSARSSLRHPESQCSKECVHVSFTAKPKIADCSDASPIYLFGELFEGYRTSHANSCFTFKPSDVPGFNHGCTFCSADQKFHPATGYHVGRLPWYLPGTTWI